MPALRFRRIYDSPTPGDGYRVLVDRLWPRGVRKTDAELDLWAKDLAPTGELRKRYHADGDFEEFRRRYEDELADADEELVEQLRGHERLTLLTAAKDVERSHVPVLADFLRG